jgi:hypothetical protein
VGFDIALLAAFAFAAWFGWRTRQLVITALIVTGTLLLCDAWFDLTMSWGSDEETASLVTAAIAEIPFAVGLFFVAGQILHRTTAYVWRLSGNPGEAPRLWRLPILISPAARRARGGSRPA